MTTRFTLNDWGEEDLEIAVLAISSHLPNYRFAYKLSEALSYRFEERVEPIVLPIQNETASFSVYRAHVVSYSGATTLFLVDNVSYEKTNENNAVGLFNDLPQAMRFFQTRNNWDYLLFSNDINYLNKPLASTSKSVIAASQPIGFERINKDRQHIIKDLYYENER